MFNVRLSIDEQRNDLGASLKAGERQRRISIGFNLRIDVRAHIQEEFHRSHMSVHRREHQRLRE